MSWKYSPNARTTPSSVSASTGRTSNVTRSPAPRLARGDRPLPRRLDELEDLATRLLDDDLAEQRAEQPDLAREHVRAPGRPDAPGLRPFRMPALGRHRRSVSAA